MPRISRYTLNKNQTSLLKEHFSHLISTLSNANEIENFIDQFYTKEEKLMLAKRLTLFMLLKKDYSPSIIQSLLHISYETIRTYSNLLNSKNDLFLKTIERVANRQKSKDLFTKIEKMLKPLDLALRSKTDMKARAKFISGDFD